MPPPDAHLDERAAARAGALRAQCALPIAAVHGSLVGRPEGAAWGVAIEPGGRHAAVLVHDAVERWDLDALACVGRWSLPPGLYPSCVACVAEAPAGLRFVAGIHRWRGLEPAAPLTVIAANGSLHMSHLTPKPPTVIEMVDGEVPVLVRLADGVVVCDLPMELRCWCDPAARWVVVERSRTSFDVLEVKEGTRTPRRAACVAVDEALDGEARVAVDGPGRRLAVVMRSAVVTGAWDDWSGARTFPVPALPWTDCAFCGDGRTLVLCAKGRVAWVDVATGRTVEAHLESTERWGSFAVDPSLGCVLYADDAGLQVADPGSPSARARYADHLPFVTAAAPTPDGRALVTSASDGSIRVRDRASGEVLAQMECPTREPHAVLVTPDGREVLGVGVTDGVLRWSRATGEPLAQVGLGKASRPEPSQAVVSPDGRHLALAPSAVFLVDLATGSARRLRRLPHIHSARGTLCLGFDARSARVRGATFSDYGQRVTFWSRALAGGSAALEGESASARGRLLTPSSDGRLLWWACEDGEDLTVCVTVAAASVAATAVARWPVGGWVQGCCAGRSLLAVAAGGDVVLFAARGRSLCTGLPDGCRPLAFAADERALWVLDPVGLLLELTVPEALLDPPRG